MKSIDQIKSEKDKAVDALIKDCQMFFAFSNEQFDRNKVALAEGDKYLNLGAGCFMPKSKLSAWEAGTKAIDKTYKAEIKANKQRNANILHELINREAFYTNDIEETVEALGEGYTEAEVRLVYNKHKSKIQNEFV